MEAWILRKSPRMTTLWDRHALHLRSRTGAGEPAADPGPFPIRARQAVCPSSIWERPRISGFAQLSGDAVEGVKRDGGGVYVPT